MIYDNNSHLERVQVRTAGKNSETWLKKKGYKYLLKDDFAQDPMIVRAADGVRWWDLSNNRYVDGPGDVFTIDEIERTIQLKKNWRVRLPIKEARLVY